jgi:hypothetical protein
MDYNTLRSALKKDQIEAYIRLRGGFPLPLAGAVYWCALGIAGYYLALGPWLQFALFGSGAIFPIGLLIAKITKNNFMKDKQASGNVILPALIGMLLFWPMLIAAMKTNPQLAILILAIGMSIHWPVIGWSYGRTALFSAHSIVRAFVVLGIWVYMPEARTTLLPFSVTIIYLVTVLAILVDTSKLRKQIQTV